MVLLALAVLLLKVACQGLLWPLELAADEAHYWDWSRRPALSYHTKGPWVAWMIALSVKLFGIGELGVRFPAYLANAVATCAAGALGAALAGGALRGALFGALALQAVSAYQVSGSLMTVDMQMVAGWLSGTALAAWALRRAAAGLPIAGLLGLAGLCFAQAFLAKYTALLGALGVFLALCQAPVLRAHSQRHLGLGLFLGGCALGAVPVLLWNAQHDWATVRHLLLHLEAGGVGGGPVFDWRWPVTYVAMTLGAAGPVQALALAEAGRWAWRGTPAGLRSDRSAPQQLEASLLRVCLWSALPVLMLYLLVSCVAPTEGNWAIGAYGPLAVLAGERQRRAWAAGGAALRRLGLAALACGALTLLLVLTFPLAARALGAALEPLGVRVPLYRVSGQRAFAAALEQRVQSAWSALALPGEPAEAPLIADYYSRAALLAFYLPGRPRVRCASAALMARPSSYDDFADTRLPDPGLLGRPVVLVGQSAERWSEAYTLEVVAELGTVTESGRPRPLLIARLLSFDAADPATPSDPR
jgi:undecaprenyl-diphosphatase